MKELEMWGGIECTLNRVGDRYINQCEKNGHNHRLTDLALFKELGIKKLRYPCLWELVAPKDLDHCNWSWLDERLSELKRLDQKFIAGFLHHGSGPVYTSLIDPQFPQKLATYARLFATRYPWVSDYTPINEINTTARFSLLYGHWYPHLQNTALYLKSILIQCKGTILAMKEIRRINPGAKLIQTDDLGKCQSTPELQEQRDLENERRWLAWDLLCGKVNKDHALYHLFLKEGITPQELEWFEENPFPPDLIGINHYQLSNRYLDHRIEMFPEWSHGGNGTQVYADVGAVDTGLVDPVYPDVLLREAWERFGIPLAITECHARGRRESQMRWLNLIWNTCKNLRSEGIPIEAVTAWSLTGTYDWHNLCTKCENFYEPGVFDLRNPSKTPQWTALATMIRSLATKGSFESPLLGADGVWETGRRILFNVKPGQFTSIIQKENSRPILITGGSGTLGQAFARICGARNIHYKLLSRSELELTSRKSIEEALEFYDPWAVINAAGYVKVDLAEDDPLKCFQENVEGAVNLARACRNRSVKLVNFSSDLVFDGNTHHSYVESDRVSPLNVYGKSKVECEEQVLSIFPDSLVIRTAAFFSPWDEYNFITSTLRLLSDERPISLPNDQFVSPTYLPDLANETLDLLIDGESGIIHLTNAGEVSWEEFAIKAITLPQQGDTFNRELIKGVSSQELNLRARRPLRSVLNSERHGRLPTLDDALKRYYLELQVPLKKQQEIR
ncbi:MAG: sugar nucleotide-binding protein [Bacteriovoracia bacterium]